MEVTGVVTIGIKERSKRDMKKIVFAFGLIVAVAMTACTPETLNERLGIPEDAILLSSERFSGHGTKTSVSDISVKWVNEDKVYLNGSEYSVTVDNSGNAYVNASDEIRNSEVYGYYGVLGTPSWNSSEKKLTVTVPAEYTSSFDGDRQVIALPMVAYKSGAADNIEFKHVSAAVKVRVKNSTANVLFLDSVIVSSDENNLSGGVELTLTEGDLGLTAASGDGSVKVTFSSASIAVGEICEVQVPILPISEDNLSISVYTHNADITGLPITGLTHTFAATKTAPALGRNVMLTAQVKIDPVSANVVSKGTFSVSADKAVYFSMGNLKYSRNSTSDDWTTGTWSFMTNQYDVVETADVSANYASQTAIGLFGYGTSGYDNGQTCYQPWSTSYTSSNYYSSNLTGNADWGYNAISNGGNQENSGWRTPEGGPEGSGEWYYLLYQRTPVTAGLPNGTGSSSARYMHATIKDGDNSYKGMIIFPDNYNHPSGVTFGNSYKYNNYSSFTATISNLTDWGKMASAGAIFLPVTGMRISYSDPVTTVSNLTSGYYRSSTFSSGTTVYALLFGSSSPSWSLYNGTYRGYAVRLVRDAN